MLGSWDETLAVLEDLTDEQIASGAMFLSLLTSDLEGRPIAAEEAPLAAALRHEKPMHRTMRIQTVRGKPRDIAVTALPLFAHADEVVGAMALFWEHEATGGRA